MSSSDILALAIGPTAMLATYGCIRLTHAVLDFADRKFAEDALSHDPYGNDRVLGEWPRAADEISFHAETISRGGQGHHDY
jgi:hypothetical protein